MFRVCKFVRLNRGVGNILEREFVVMLSFNKVMVLIIFVGKGLFNRFFLSCKICKFIWLVKMLGILFVRLLCVNFKVFSFFKFVSFKGILFLIWFLFKLSCLRFIN